MEWTPRASAAAIPGRSSTSDPKTRRIGTAAEKSRGRYRSSFRRIRRQRGRERQVVVSNSVPPSAARGEVSVRTLRRHRPHVARYEPAHINPEEVHRVNERHFIIENVNLPGQKRFAGRNLTHVLLADLPLQSGLIQLLLHQAGRGKIVLRVAASKVFLEGCAQLRRLPRRPLGAELVL